MKNLKLILIFLLILSLGFNIYLINENQKMKQSNGDRIRKNLEQYENQLEQFQTDIDFMIKIEHTTRNI